MGRDIKIDMSEGKDNFWHGSMVNSTDSFFSEIVDYKNDNYLKSLDMP